MPFLEPGIGLLIIWRSNFPVEISWCIFSEILQCFGPIYFFYLRMRLSKGYFRCSGNGSAIPMCFFALWWRSDWTDAGSWCLVGCYTTFRSSPWVESYTSITISQPTCSRVCFQVNQSFFHASWTTDNGVSGYRPVTSKLPVVIDFYCRPLVENEGKKKEAISE